MSTSDDEKAVRIAKLWLKSKGCTLWMDWDLSSDGELHEAATWFVDNMNSLVDFYEATLEESLDW